MSKKPETLFSNQLIKNLNKVFWTRIENKHGGGIPDLYGTYNNKSAFLELKIKTKQNKVIISPLQISWNYKHLQPLAPLAFFLDTISRGLASLALLHLVARFARHSI